MQVTDVRIRKIITDGSRVKAIASVTFDDEFVVHDVRVIEGQEHLIVAMPSKMVSVDGQYQKRIDVAHPINRETRARIETAVIQAYDRAVSDSAAS